MSVECLCINDKNRPDVIPINKWVKEGNKYNVIYTVTVLPSRQLAFDLSEIQLTENEFPYEHFLANRFAFKEEDLHKLAELVKDCTDLQFSISELMEQTQLQEC